MVGIGNFALGVIRRSENEPVSYFRLLTKEPDAGNEENQTAYRVQDQEEEMLTVYQNGCRTDTHF